MSDGKPESVKREWSVSDGDFLFEIVHIGEPANNMATFHWHDYMELSYIQENEGRYEIEDRTYQVAKGDVVIINNIERHRVTYEDDRPLYETVIHFDPKMIWFKEDPTMEYGFLKLFKHNRIAFNNRPELTEGTRGELGRLFAEITREYQEKRRFHKLLIKARLLTVIALLLRECPVEALEEGAFQSRQNQIDRLKRILAYIDANSASEIGLESTAAQFQFNASYFSDYFKKQVGITFTEYLARVRVHEAIKLMTENRASSTDAAYECGFNNTASFYAAFKRVTGTNPGDYLRNRAEG
jgi:AraC-like DNA-binding protein/quercetin dioxygenase-like cupin family protein